MLPDLLDDDASYTLEKPTLLVVDDSKTMRRAIVRLLSQEMNVLEADDGDTAWELIRDEHAIQVVFADLMMPRMNGFMLLRQIRESIHERIKQLPVIIMTGHEDDENMCRQAMVLGATDFITKPFDSLQLRARAKAHIRSGDTQRKLQEASTALEQRSTIDPITGLANLNHFREHGEVLLSFALRHAANLSVLRITIDQFESIEAKHGRAVADRILGNIGKVISHCVRKEDTVAHIARAQFAVLMLDAGTQGASQIARRIHALMRKTSYRLGEVRFSMTASLGLVTPELLEHLRFDEVVKLAEGRVQKALALGGDCVVLDEKHPPATDKAMQRQALPLEQALVLLRAGDQEAVRPHLPRLLHSLLPLLELADQHYTLNLSASLATLAKPTAE